MIISSFFRIAVHWSEATVVQAVLVMEEDNHVELVTVFKCWDIEAGTW